MFRFCSFSKEGYLPHLPSSVGFLLSLKKVLGPHSLFTTEVAHTPISTSFRECIDLGGSLDRSLYFSG